MDEDTVTQNAITEMISTTIHQLSSEDHQAATDAARLLFELAHTSHFNNENNKVMIGAAGAVPALCRLLQSTVDETRYQACSALSEMAFRNEQNCMAIVHTPEALSGLVSLLQITHGNNQEDAALVVNNCAAFCEEASPIIVSCPGMIESLKALAVNGQPGAKNVAVGALNCLSRSREAATLLLEANAVEEALMLVLEEEGTGEKHEARLARATMALANLTGASEVKSFNSCFAEKSNYGTSLQTIVRILGFALDGKKWAGIFFAPYSVMFPLYNLTAHEQNRAPLVQCGVIEVLARLLKEWRPGHQADRTLDLAMRVAETLSTEWEWRQRMRAAGAVAALQDIRVGRRGEPEACRVAADKLLLLLLEGHVAFWMGQHARLGEKSRVMVLDDYVAGIILEYAFGASICRVSMDHVVGPAAAEEACKKPQKCNCG